MNIIDPITVSRERNHYRINDSCASCQHIDHITRKCRKFFFSVNMDRGICDAFSSFANRSRRSSAKGT